MERKFTSIVDVDRELARLERERSTTRSPALKQKLELGINFLRVERGRLERDGEGVPRGARAQGTTRAPGVEAFERAHELAGAVCKSFIDKAFRVHDESQLQNAVAGVFRGDGIEFEEQVVLGPGERIDFMVGRVGVELKVKGSWADLLRQLDRYAAHDRIQALVVVSTRRHLIISLPRDVRGKPLLKVAAGAL